MMIMVITMIMMIMVMTLILMIITNHNVPWQLDFTFDQVRSFRRLTIHVNNHYLSLIHI